MAVKYKNIFSPVQINTLTLKNRIVMPPMIFGFGVPYGMDTDKRIEMYARRARGGAAMLIVGPYFSPRPIDAPPNLVAKVPALSPYWDHNMRIHFMVEAVQANGSRICASLSSTPMLWLNKALQLRHDKLDMDSWEHSVLESLDVCNDLSTAEVEDNIAEFGMCASQIKQAGFDAIEINFSYLPDYFSLARFNKRKDKYHYSDEPDQRYRYHKDLLNATRSAVGSDFPIMTMWDIDNFRPEWRTLEDSRIMAPKIEQWGGDSIRTRSGNSIDVHYDISPQYLPIGHTAYLADAMKKVVGIPVIANGKLTDPDFAENLISNGKADLISIGRGLIADPDLPNKWRAGKEDRVRKCIYCCVGCYGNSVRFPSRGSRCSVNPLFGNEEHFKSLNRSQKKVLIIGGGPAGMSAALTAAQKGCDVILCEKSRELGAGGEFYLSTLPPNKEENLFIPEYYKREFVDLDNIQVRLNTEVDVERVLQEDPDVVIIATGGKPLVPNILGVTDTSVVSYMDILTDKHPTDKQYIIVGGGQVGCETAHYLANLGKQVTLLEMLPALLSGVNRATKNCLLQELDKSNVQSITGAKVTEISNKKVRYLKKDTEDTVAGDKIVLATGTQSENSLYFSLLDKIVDLRLIGDAKEPRQIMNAVIEGFYTAYYI